MASTPPPKYYWLKVRTIPQAESTATPRYDGCYLRLHGGGFSTIMVMPSPPKFIRGLVDPYAAKGDQNKETPDARRVMYERIGQPERTWGLSLGRSGADNKVAGWEAVRLRAEFVDSQCRDKHGANPHLTQRQWYSGVSG